MGIVSASVRHNIHGLSQVAEVSRQLDSISQRLLNHDCIDAVVVLSTCNRVDVYADSAKSAAIADIEAAIAHELNAQPSFLHGKAAIEHIFGVAAGLDSMVIGEREISGQLRRAHRQAVKTHTTNADLSRVIDCALRTSRRVAHSTGLSGTGRSIVSLALDCVSTTWEDAPHKAQVLLIGTGAYAGATVAQLRGRQIEQISVYSQSGRARAFAQAHELTPVDDDAFVAALANSDIVVACRGLGNPIITADLVNQVLPLRTTELVILDLALQTDVQSEVGKLRGVRLITLENIQALAPEAAQTHVQRARELIQRGVEEVIAQIDSRRIDPVVVAFREHITDLCTGEVERLPEKETFTKEEVARALGHFASRIAHTPTVLARQAAEMGNDWEYVRALHSVLGIDVSQAAREANIRPAEIASGGKCPLSAFLNRDTSLGESASA
ncbi:glutamyl-tRNA reductase [Arcanobacterium pluranimalium]|uniref:glutamyl-tRNA reductase n=1 Tax=Arcanobacterium pluranimalium TaxID=108028 RepID=UPI00195F1330|nr:glutamyl-tRNA reductase [Arcanobacterium pluranimalium]